MDRSEVVAVAEALQPRDQFVFDVHRIPLGGSILHRAAERWPKIVPVTLVVVIEVSQLLCKPTQSICENRKVFSGLNHAQPDPNVFNPPYPLLPDAGGP